MKKPDIIDISMPLRNGMLTWPDSPSFELAPFKKIAEGASSNVSRLFMTTHCGTHIDAPRHFIEEGKTLDEIALTVFNGRARVFNAGMRKKIDRKFLEQLGFEGVQRALFRSVNSAYLSEKKFRETYVYFSEDAAEFLVEKKITLLGTDYLSVEDFSDSKRPAHHILLGAGIVLLEGLNLLSVREGDYELVCLPLKLIGADGAPARAILKRVS
jgi:arylformamidase